MLITCCDYILFINCLYIYSGAECDIRIKNNAVSRIHAKIEIDENNMVRIDSDSMIYISMLTSYL